jgi:hypothetical protein
VWMCMCLHACSWVCTCAKKYYSVLQICLCCKYNTLCKDEQLLSSSNTEEIENAYLFLGIFVSPINT